MLIEEKLTGMIIDAAIDVHKTLCPCLLESAYEKCMGIKLGLRGIRFKSQVEIPLEYKGTKVTPAYRADIIVDEKVIMELKTIESILPIHEAQLLSYLKLTKLRIGLILNFNTPLLKDGIKRMVL